MNIKISTFYVDDFLLWLKLKGYESLSTSEKNYYKKASQDTWETAEEAIYSEFVKIVKAETKEHPRD